jgi:copper homeostasis protein
MIVLEVIACSVEDALQAERGGAHRLEVISHFEVGGLTPPLELVRQIRAAVSLPLRVMLRDNSGYGISHKAEAEALCAKARELNGMGIEGIVLGFLRAGEIDVELMSRLLDCAPDLKATCHHAFDETEDRLRAIDELLELKQVNRILTSGGMTSLSQQIANLAAYQKAAGPNITVLAGGGLNAAKINAIRAATNIIEFHIGRAARLPASVDGDVSADRVREIIEQTKIGI